MFQLKKKQQIIILTILLVSIAIGETGFGSLKIVPATREAGMAGTGVAAGQGPQSIYFNPASISRYNNFMANLYYAKWFLGTHHQSFFVVRPTKIFNIGLGVVNFSYGELQQRPDYPTDRPSGYFSPQDYSFFLTLSRALDHRTAIGISGKFYYQKILDLSSSSGGIDIGMKFEALSDLTFGFSVINFGSTMSFLREKFWLPTQVKAGASYDNPIQNHSLIGALDVSYLPYDKKLKFDIGAEFGLNENLFIRAGLSPLSETNKISSGLGVKLNNFRLDYAFCPYTNDLGITHRFSIGFGY